MTIAKKSPLESRELGFVEGLGISESFDDSLPDAELEAWEGDSNSDY